jgi:hypothetical protein
MFSALQISLHEEDAIKNFVGTNIFDPIAKTSTYFKALKNDLHSLSLANNFLLALVS